MSSIFGHNKFRTKSYANRNCKYYLYNECLALDLKFVYYYCTLLYIFDEANWRLNEFNLLNNHLLIAIFEIHFISESMNNEHWCVVDCQLLPPKPYFVKGILKSIFNFFKTNYLNWTDCELKWIGAGLEPFFRFVLWPPGHAFPMELCRICLSNRGLNRMKRLIVIIYYFIHSISMFIVLRREWTAIENLMLSFYVHINSMSSFNIQKQIFYLIFIVVEFLQTPTHILCCFDEFRRFRCGYNYRFE